MVVSYASTRAKKNFPFLAGGRLAGRIERELRSVEADIDASTQRLDALHLRKSELRAGLMRLREVMLRAKNSR
jgi:hypothetical protein